MNSPSLINPVSGDKTLNRGYILKNKRISSSIIIIIINILLITVLAGCSKTEGGGPQVLPMKFPGTQAGKASTPPPPVKN